MDKTARKIYPASSPWIGCLLINGQEIFYLALSFWALEWMDRRALTLVIAFLFWRFGVLVQGFQVMGNGQGFIGFALFFDPFRPNSISQVGPIIFAFFQFLPASFQVFFPFRQPEKIVSHISCSISKALSFHSRLSTSRTRWTMNPVSSAKASDYGGNAANPSRLFFPIVFGISTLWQR